MLGFSKTSLALNDFKVEDLADLTAVFIYLKIIVGTDIYRIPKSSALSFISPNKISGI